MGKADIWMPLYIGDFVAATTRLSPAQIGAYIRLICDYWRSGPPLDDDDQLARIAGTDLAEWQKIRPYVERYFAVKKGVWRHDRIERELSTAKNKAQKAVEKAKKAAEKRWSQAHDSKRKSCSEHAPSMLQAMLEQCPSPSPSPTEVDRRDKSLLVDNVDSVDAGGDFEAAWRAYPHVRGRSSKKRSAAIWARMSAASREAVAGAIRRYADSPIGECGAPALERWLRDERWHDWLVEPERAAPTVPVNWRGPQAIWAAVCDERGEAWAASWLGRCGWRDLPEPAILAPSTLVRDRLRQEARHLVGRARIELAAPAAVGGAA